MEKINNLETRKIGIFALILLPVLITLIAVSYAFFSSITSNDNKEKLTLTSGSLELTFKDNNQGNIDASMEFGDVLRKEFILENTGTRDVIAKISWKDLVNTYLFKSLSYTLTYSETYSESGEGYTKAKTTNDNVPPSTAPSEEELINGFRVPAGKTYYCLLTITLNNLDGVDQSADLNAHLSTGFTIEEGIPQLLKDKMIMLSKGSVPDFNKVAPHPISYRDGEPEATSNSIVSLNTDSQTGWNYRENYFTYSTGYTYDEETGLYSLNEPVEVVKYEDGLDVLKDKYVVTHTGVKASNKAKYTNLGYICKIKNTSTLETIHYSTITKVPLSYDYSSDGLFKAQDDYGTSYYYRGAVTNNYLKFGKNENGEDMYWRIVRLNGDGTLRIVYDGTQAWDNGVGSSNRVAFNSSWNTKVDDNKYVGYMYGGQEGTASTSLEEAQKNEIPSTIKTKLEEWYEKIFKDTEYEQYIADGIFCNDRSILSGNGFGETATYYNTRDRLVTNKIPRLTCSNKNDAFTSTESDKGNGKLTYPIGLLTADEVAYAGGKYYNSDGSAVNRSYYLNKGVWYWLFSPYYMNGTYASMFRVGDSNGFLDITIVNNTGGAVVPVINIKAECLDLFEGTGSASSPYELSVFGDNSN